MGIWICRGPLSQGLIFVLYLLVSAVKVLKEYEREPDVRMIEIPYEEFHDVLINIQTPSEGNNRYFRSNIYKFSSVCFVLDTIIIKDINYRLIYELQFGLFFKIQDPSHQ